MVDYISNTMAPKQQSTMSPNSPSRRRVKLGPGNEAGVYEKTMSYLFNADDEAERPPRRDHGEDLPENRRTTLGEEMEYDTPEEELDLLSKEDRKWSAGFATRIDDKQYQKMVRSLLPRERAHVTLRNVSVSAQPHIRGREFDTVWTAFLSPFRACFTKKEDKTILSNLTTCFEPGALCLVIGPPQCSKTALLKLVSGQTDKNCNI